MVLQKKCPYCNSNTYMDENMPNAFCIACGRRISVAGAAELNSEAPKETTEKTFTITFCYERRFASEYDTGCQITVDNHLSGISSVDEPLSVKLTEGNHNVTIKVLAHIGVKSTDVISSVSIYVDSDKKYYIKAQGSSFNRKIMFSDMKN